MRELTNGSGLSGCESWEAVLVYTLVKLLQERVGVDGLG
jgi:hypothetical protein